MRGHACSSTSCDVYCAVCGLHLHLLPLIPACCWRPLAVRQRARHLADRFLFSRVSLFIVRKILLESTEQSCKIYKFCLTLSSPTISEDLDRSKKEDTIFCIFLFVGFRKLFFPLAVKKKKYINCCLYFSNYGTSANYSYIIFPFCYVIQY